MLFKIIGLPLTQVSLATCPEKNKVNQELNFGGMAEVLMKMLHAEPGMD